MMSWIVSMRAHPLQDLDTSFSWLMAYQRVKVCCDNILVLDIELD